MSAVRQFNVLCLAKTQRMAERCSILETLTRSNLVKSTPRRGTLPSCIGPKRVFETERKCVLARQANVLYRTTVTVPKNLTSINNILS
jgi:hypothetical protein